MNFKHFLKTLLLFAFMIGLGLLGVYLLDNYNKNNTSAKGSNTSRVAK